MYFVCHHRNREFVIVYRDVIRLQRDVVSVATHCGSVSFEYWCVGEEYSYFLLLLTVCIGTVLLLFVSLCNASKNGYCSKIY